MLIDKLSRRNWQAEDQKEKWVSQAKIKKKLLQFHSTCDSEANTDLLMDDNEEYDTNLEDQKTIFKEIEFLKALLVL